MARIVPFYVSYGNLDGSVIARVGGKLEIPRIGRVGFGITDTAHSTPELPDATPTAGRRNRNRKGRAEKTGKVPDTETPECAAAGVIRTQGFLGASVSDLLNLEHPKSMNRSIQRLRNPYVGFAALIAHVQLAERYVNLESVDLRSSLAIAGAFVPKWQERGFKGIPTLSAADVDGFIQSLRESNQLDTAVKIKDKHVPVEATGGYPSGSGEAHNYGEIALLPDCLSITRRKKNPLEIGMLLTPNQLRLENGLATSLEMSNRSISPMIIYGM